MENARVGKEDDQIDLPPGFRFHPTDEELISHYLLKKVVDVNFSARAMGEADLNESEPWELPMKAKMGETVWYFFCVKDRKYPTGMRTNRATKAGYWKATGKDKEIHRGKLLIGMKKTLVFYRGRAPKGEKTNWVMHEYRLDGKLSHHNLTKTAKKEWVISRVFEKPSPGKKIHIPGLTRAGSFLNEADCAPPPLMDSSPRTTEAKPMVELADVPCFSNSIDSASAPRNKEGIDPFHSDINPPFSASAAMLKIPIHGSVYPAQPFSIPQNLQLQFPSTVQLQEQSILGSLLYNPNLKTGREIITSAQQTGHTSIVENPELSSIMPSFESGQRAMFCDQHQQAPSTSSAGPADLDCIMELLRRNT